MYNNSVPNPLAPIQNESASSHDLITTEAGVASAAHEVGQLVLQNLVGTVQVQGRTVSQLKACLGESAFYRRIASDPRVTAAMGFYFDSYQVGSENRGIQFFNEEGGSNLNQLDPKRKAASLLLSDLCAGGYSERLANEAGLNELRTSLKLLVPTLGSEDIDCVLLHIAFDSGAAVSNEGWTTQTMDPMECRNGTMTGPVANCIQEGLLHCLRVIADRGKVNVNAELPARASGMLGARDLPYPLTLAVYNTNPQAVELLLKLGANPNGTPSNDVDRLLNSPLAVAVRVNAPELARLLVRSGADVGHPLYLTRDVNLIDPNAYPIHVGFSTNSMDSARVYSYVPNNPNDVGYTRFSSIDYFVHNAISDSKERADFVQSLKV